MDPYASPAGLTRGSIILGEKFLRRRWMAGSSPAMTTSLPLHRLRRGDELIERLAPPVAEAHAIVRIAILLVLMHGKRGIFRSFSVRLQHDDRCEGRNIEGGVGRPEAGRKRHGPGELAVRHDLEEAADIRDVFAFRRAHHRAEDAAGAKVDFAIDRFPRRRREPFLDMLGHGPRCPYELRSEERRVG